MKKNLLFFCLLFLVSCFEQVQKDVSYSFVCETSDDIMDAGLNLSILRKGSDTYKVRVSEITFAGEQEVFNGEMFFENGLLFDSSRKWEVSFQEESLEGKVLKVRGERVNPSIAKLTCRRQK